MYPDDRTLGKIGIKDSVFKLLNTLGWVDMLKPMWGFKNFTYEFLSSISFTKDGLKSENPDRRVSFRLLNIDYEMSLEMFCIEIGFTNLGFIHDSFDHSLRPEDYNPAAFWKRIIGLEQYNSHSNKASNIHNPVLRYLQRVMACTIWGRKEVGPTRTDELFMLWAMLYDHPVNTCYYLLDHLSSVGNKRSNEKGDIVVGGVITYIARMFGVGENKGINKIEGNNRLDLDTVTAMFMIKPQPSLLSFELKLSAPHILFVLPNPPRTDPEVETNLLYFGVDQQAQEDHGIDYTRHHEHEANEQFDAERWEWMQMEI